MRNRHKNANLLSYILHINNPDGSDGNHSTQIFYHLQRKHATRTFIQKVLSITIFTATNMLSSRLSSQISDRIATKGHIGRETSVTKSQNL